MVKGSTCNGIQVYRGTDSLQLEKIGEIFGVCGSVDEPVDFSFVDEEPVKGDTNYYRIQFGTQGYSSIISIAVIGLGNNIAQVRPHPVHSNGTIYFSSASSQTYYLYVYTLHGQEVFTQTTPQNYFEIDALGLKNGLYTYTIKTEESALLANGKLVVQH